MAVSIKNRIFGADISPKIKQKLEYRQAFAKSANPGESITAIIDKYGWDSIDYKSNFDGVADLSSRTPFARMWTSLDIAQDIIHSPDLDEKKLNVSPLQYAGGVVLQSGRLHCIRDL